MTFGNSPSVRLLGKGNKTRYCPLWPATADMLKQLTSGMAPLQGVFMGRRGLPLTRFGIYYLVHKAAKQASSKAESIQSKRVSPHTIRHTAAVHALRSGMDINTLRGWLGHVSVDTTNIYAEVDLEMKAKALAHCDTFSEPTVKRWRKEPTLMAFLKAL